MISGLQTQSARRVVFIGLGILASACLSTCSQATPSSLLSPSTTLDRPISPPQVKTASSQPQSRQTAARPSTPITFTAAQYKAAIFFDFEGENGKSPTNPSARSIGYPCGVPSSYSWKYGTYSVSDITKVISGRGPQTAAAAYNQVYNACGTRKSMPNARIEFTDMVVYYYSIKLGRWVKAVQQPVGGAAFAEDFVNNQATQADIRNEAQGHKSVRSGINNAAQSGGSKTNRTGVDGAVGYNFHGFPNRFSLNWADAKAIVVAQAMRCIPHAGKDLRDCQKLGYLANVGLDSWATAGSNFDNFKTHGGVSGGRFKPVTTNWQVFTNYIGALKTNGLPMPPTPQF
jgi:hypothetical protein